MPSLAERAAAVLRNNDRGSYTVPAPRLYPHQWAWDSAFAAIGWAYLSPERALAEIETLLAGQWTDGRVPHIQFHVQTPDYFPGPEAWGLERSSAITNPPVWTIAARRLVEAGMPVQRVAHLLPALERSHEFFYQHRDPLGWNLVAVSHPWESGRDNAPEWDAPLARVPLASLSSFRRVDRSFVGSAGERPSDESYQRYVFLLRAISRDGFGPGPFRVYDPFVSAVLARAEQDLAWLAKEAGMPSKASARARAVRDGLVDHLWDAPSGCFAFFDAVSRERHTPDVLAAYTPLWLDLPEDLNARLRGRLANGYQTTWPLPSTPPQNPAYLPRCYWRGPAWVNMNWLLAAALGESGRALAKRTLELVERHGFWEYFHPMTGEGLGTDDFTWTAALVLDWLHATG